jgi:hypothetical protein
MSFEWPEKKSFVCSYACKSLPRTGSSKFFSAIAGPVWNLAPLPDQFAVAAFSWAVLYALYYYISEKMPINVLNSNDGQFVDLSTAMVSSFVIYYIVTFGFIFVSYQKGCELWVEQAKTFLYTAPEVIPSSLSSSAWPIDEDK